MRLVIGGHQYLSSNFIILRNPRPFFGQRVFNSKFMAQKPNSSPIRSQEEKKEDKKSEMQVSPSPPPPPPPEKPLAGDCCGSGCVRCVWDIYYEELEHYNKLYQHK